jgi:hypothetical protein
VTSSHLVCFDFGLAGVKKAIKKGETSFSSIVQGYPSRAGSDKKMGEFYLG